MMGAPDIAVSGPVRDGPPPPKPLVSTETRLEEQRNTLVQQDAIADLAEMSQDDFEKALARAKTARQRVEHILDHVLVPGAHFGNPEVRGAKAFKHPILFLAGAEALITMFRLQVGEVHGKERETLIVPPTLDAGGKIVDPGFVSITVCLGIRMGNGVDGGSTIANCNSREKRFRKSYGEGKWTYEDARETIHDCISIAIKRAVVRLVRGALGLTPWLATEEEMDAASERDKQKLLSAPWTKADKEKVYAAAREVGITTKGKFAEFVQEILGRQEIGTGEDVAALLNAIAKRANPDADDLEDEDDDEDDLAEDRAVVDHEDRVSRTSASATARRR